jgi:hypothetical protein
LQISIGSAADNPFTRVRVACSIVSSAAKGKNCFGQSERDKGQRREPEPPAITTILIIIKFFG